MPEDEGALWYQVVRETCPSNRLGRFMAPGISHDRDRSESPQT